MKGLNMVESLGLEGLIEGKGLVMGLKDIKIVKYERK